MGGESRVNLVCQGMILGQARDGATLRTKQDSDLVGATRQACQFRWKIEVWKKDADGKVQQVIIRHDCHPQRAIDSKLGLVWKTWTHEHYWNVQRVYEDCISPAYLCNVETDMYLGVEETGPILSKVPQEIHLLPAGSAPSPGQVALWFVGVPLAVASASVHGLVAGAGVSFKEVLANLGGWSALPIGSAVGVTSLFNHLRGLVGTAESHHLVFVDKC